MKKIFQLGCDGQVVSVTIKPKIWNNLRDCIIENDVMESADALLSLSKYQNGQKWTSPR